MTPRRRLRATGWEARMDPWDLSIGLFGGLTVAFFGAAVFLAMAG
jgi:hypothetical protein